MDGKLNCSMNAENAAFTKLRHLENRVSQVEGELDNVEQQVASLDGDLQDALTNLQEKVTTSEVDTTLLNANNIEAANATIGNATVTDLNATSIEAETIDVDNLENVNVLHGKTVDVDKTIATIGQFTETQTTTANNETINTEELNVSTEANLTGQVNIDGNMTFTKDNGLSKLQGEYLEIDAANVVIDNKNSAEYALYVPGIDGDALFGGSVAVQDTLAAKNLVVAETAVINNAQLSENTVLTNPTLADIKQTQEVSSTCIDLDEDGKLIRVNIGTSSEVVATALKSVVDDVEKVNISAEGAVFSVPVTVNDTANINTADITSLSTVNATSNDITSETITINDKATIKDIETSTIDAEVVKTIDAEIGEMKFYEGEWYDAIISTKEELISIVANNLSSAKKLNVLYTGTGLAFTAADDFSGATYSSTDHHITVKAKSTTTVTITGENALAVSNKAAYFFGRLAFVNFNVNVDIVNQAGISYVSVKDGSLYISDFSGIFTDTTPSLHFMNLDNIKIGIIFPSLAYTNATIRFEDCHLVIPSSSVSINTSALQGVTVRIDNSDRCSLNIGVDSSLITLTQYRAGSNAIFGNSVYITPTIKY